MSHWIRLLPENHSEYALLWEFGEEPSGFRWRQEGSLVVGDEWQAAWPSYLVLLPIGSFAEVKIFAH